MAIYTLENSIQKYDWGSPSALPLLLGMENPTGEPWAELWMGAHPKAPSLAIDPVTGRGEPLDRLIALDPSRILGVTTAGRFGGSLPFLLKILSASRPLSIQAHPSKLKAEHGFAQEELKGIPIDAPERNYKDANHKPETVVALTEFEGLCGFRRIDDILENVKTLAPGQFERFAGRLSRDPGKLELSVFFYTFISMADDDKAELLRFARERSDAIVAAEPHDSPVGRMFSWVLRLMDAYPGDVGALAPLILNLFRLEPGQALNLSAGEAHAYLCGTAVEIMANSDNVLRGGLTSKHMDVPEFISSLNFDVVAVEAMEAGAPADGFSPYRCDVPDYSIAKAAVDGVLTSSRRVPGPEILLCTEGSLRVAGADGSGAPLARGSSVFVTADEGDYSLSGNGTVFRAGVPA